MLGGIAAFCVNDAVVKTLTRALPPGEIMAVRGVFVVAIMLAVLPRLGLAPGRPDRWAALRALAETATNALFIAGLSVLPLGDTYTLYFVAPIMLTAAAALLTRERVGWQRWGAVLLGFAGVVVVVGTPGAWRPAMVLPLVAAAFSVLRDLATRRVAPGVGSGSVALATGVAATLGGTLTLPFAWTSPGLAQVALCLLAAFGAAAGYLLFVMGVRIGELSFVAPFRYAGIPVAMALGLALWGDVPSPSMLLGAAVIVGSGLLILRPERR